MKIFTYAKKFPEDRDSGNCYRVCTESEGWAPSGNYPPCFKDKEKVEQWMAKQKYLPEGIIVELEVIE